MKILLITQYFYPENFKSNDIAFELVKRGHEVDALVGIPNYPEGKIYSGYGLFKKTSGEYKRSECIPFLSNTTGYRRWVKVNDKLSELCSFFVF